MVQGSAGSYSEDAALKLYPKCETVPCKDFEDAFKVLVWHNVISFRLNLEYQIETQISTFSYTAFENTTLITITCGSNIFVMTQS